MLYRNNYNNRRINGNVIRGNSRNGINNPNGGGSPLNKMSNHPSNQKKEELLKIKTQKGKEEEYHIEDELIEEDTTIYEIDLDCYNSLMRQRKKYLL